MQALQGDPMPEEQALDTLPGVPPRTVVRLLVEDGGWRDVTATHYRDPVRQILSQVLPDCAYPPTAA